MSAKGRFRFGGSRESLLNETREDLGLSHAQMESMADESSGVLYPPLDLPQPNELTDSQAYRIQKHRILWHRMQELYSEEFDTSSANDISRSIHVTVSEEVPQDEIYIPEELQKSSRTTFNNHILSKHEIIQPRAMDKVFKNLEAKEQFKRKDKSNDGNRTEDESEMEELEEDLGDDMNDYTHDYYDSDGVMSGDDGEEVF